jgi:hypothetical protein
MKMVPSFTAKIWIAGSYDAAVEAVRGFCEEGACFSVSRCAYVYTGGMEDGVCVTRINYPRFPASEYVIKSQCERLAEFLRQRLFQDSYSIEYPDETVWFSRREVSA